MVIFLIGLYVACEVIANVTASKHVTAAGLVVPAAVFIYAITFTLIDLINERLGREGARRVVYTAFAANFLLAAYSQFAIALPISPTSPIGQDAFAGVLGATPRIVGASLTAYLIASLIDVEVFAWWRRRMGRHRWARVLASNAVSTLVDSIVFIGIAFWGLAPILPLVRGQYLIKMAITVVSIPLIYLVRGGRLGGGAGGLLAEGRY